MAARPRKLQFVARDAVKQEPIRLDMQVTESVPLASPGMIVVFGRQRALLDQQQSTLRSLAMSLPRFSVRLTSFLNLVD
jgi:hypothetical protein